MLDVVPRTVPPLDVTVAEFDRRSSDDDDSGMHRHVADEVAALVDLQPGQLVVDVAGGTGLVARAACCARSRVGTAWSARPVRGLGNKGRRRGTRYVLLVVTGTPQTSSPSR